MGQIRKTKIVTKLKDELVCRKCGATFKRTIESTKVLCPYCGAVKDTRDRKGELTPNKAERDRIFKKYEADKEKRQASASKSRALLRKRVFFKVSGSIIPSCVRCGCNDMRLLEINHKNGGGNQEMLHGKGSTRFYYNIASGKRGTEDLELLCKPCNAIHALEMKYGALPMKVMWTGSQLIE